MQLGKRKQYLKCNDSPDVRDVVCSLLNLQNAKFDFFTMVLIRGELSYLALLGSENISTPYFKQCFFQVGGVYPPD